MGVPVSAYPYVVPALVLASQRVVSYTKIGTGAASSVTLPAGTYWPDALQPEAANNLIKSLGVLFDADDAGDWSTFRQSGQGVALSAPGLATLTATTTLLEARTWLGAALTGTFTPAQLKPLGWWPSRAPFADLRWAGSGYAEVLPAWAGTASAYAAGDVQRALRLELRSVPIAEIYGRWQTLEALWHTCAHYAAPVRVYADRSALTTFLTSACTANANTWVVNSASGITQGDTLWCDGEEATVQGIAGATLTMQRTRARAHAACSPVSAAFVGTCVLADTSIKRGPEQREGVSAFVDARLDLLETESA